MDSPLRGLGPKTPLDMLGTRVEANAVLDLIGRLERAVLVCAIRYRFPGLGQSGKRSLSTMPLLSCYRSFEPSARLSSQSNLK